jgi:hypothetical protein
MTLEILVVEGLVPALPTDTFVTISKRKRQIKPKTFGDCVTINPVEKHKTNNSKCLNIPNSRTAQYQNSFFVDTVIQYHFCLQIVIVAIRKRKRDSDLHHHSTRPPRPRGKHLHYNFVYLYLYWITLEPRYDNVTLSPLLLPATSTSGMRVTLSYLVGTIYQVPRGIQDCPSGPVTIKSRRLSLLLYKNRFPGTKTYSIKLFWYWAVLLFGMFKHFELLVLCFSTGLMVTQSPNVFAFICFLR